MESIAVLGACEIVRWNIGRSGGKLLRLKISSEERADI